MTSKNSFHFKIIFWLRPSTFTSSPVLRVLSEGSGAETIHPKASGLFQSLICVSTVNSFLACQCKTEGTKEGEPITCDDVGGICETCKETHTGNYCQLCKPEYYEWPTCTRKHFQKEYIK